jgi:hypothetical protein
MGDTAWLEGWRLDGYYLGGEEIVSGVFESGEQRGQNMSIKEPLDERVERQFHFI